MWRTNWITFRSSSVCRATRQHDIKKFSWLNFFFRIHIFTIYHDPHITHGTRQCTPQFRLLHLRAIPTALDAALGVRCTSLIAQYLISIFYWASRRMSSLYLWFSRLSFSINYVLDVSVRQYGLNLIPAECWNQLWMELWCNNVIRCVYTRLNNPNNPHKYHVLSSEFTFLVVRNRISELDELQFYEIEILRKERKVFFVSVQLLYKIP